MKTIKIGTLKVYVCEHKGDIPYNRFVKFKQYAPQFWEKMDSPLFQVYWEKVMDFHNKGDHANAIMALKDYKIALDNSKGSYDAWGVCFALITEKTNGAFKDLPNDADIEAKLQEFNKAGLIAEQVTEHVLAFMKASPETFMDHLAAYEYQLTISGLLS